MKKFRTLIIAGTIVSLISYGIFSANALQSHKMIRSLSTFSESEEISVKLSKIEKFDNKKFEIYEDTTQNKYIYLNNELVGYYRDSSNSITLKTTNDTTHVASENNENKIAEYRNLAEDITKKIINTEKTNISNYELTDSYFHESYNEYVYTYTKLIDEYFTNDSITVSLDTNGEISSLSAPRQGMFNKYNNVKIDKKAVSDFIEQEVNKFVAEKSTEEELTKDTFEDYTVNNEFINIVNDKLVLEIFVGLGFEEHRETIILYYEI